MLVRPARPEEHDALGRLTAEVYLDEGWAGPDYAALLRDVGDRAATAHVLVSVDPGVTGSSVGGVGGVGSVVGGVTVATRGGPYAEQAGAGEAVMRALVTAPAARGRGTGEALVRATLELAREEGCHTMRLSTNPRMTAAHRLYERLGFTRTPDRDWEPEPGFLLWTYAQVLLWCGGCGEPGTHAHDPLDPPRWCSRCRRRMVVQVTPTGWTARCVEHGRLTG